MRPGLVSLLLVGVAVVLIVGCSGQPTTVMAPLSDVPEFLHGAPSKVRDAYRYAMANMEELEKYPCYCGCGYMGHTSNLSCYIDAANPDGTFTFDTHATGCGICLDITHDVMRLKAQGWSSPDVRTYIDATYGQAGPGTDTAFPTS